MADKQGWPPDFNGYVFLGRVIEALPPDIVWAALNSGKLDLRAWTTGAAKFQWVRAKTFRDSDRERALSTYQCETSGPQSYWLFVTRRSLIVFSLNNERESVPNPAIPLSLYWRPDLEDLPHDGVVKQASSPSYCTAEAAAVIPEPAPAIDSNTGGRPTDRDRVIGKAKDLLKTKKKYPTKAALAREIQKWLKTLDDAVRSNGEVMTIPVIEGHIGDVWRNGESISPV
jgi:hypothetical protein